MPDQSYRPEISSAGPWQPGLQKDKRLNVLGVIDEHGFS